jgi:transcription termination factor Rho
MSQGRATPTEDPSPATRVSDSALTLTRLPGARRETGSGWNLRPESDAFPALLRRNSSAARPTPSKGPQPVTDINEQTLPAAEAPSTSDAPAANGTAADPTEASSPAAPTTSKSRGGSLSAKLLPELQQIASGLGISTTKMKKSDLVAAIQAARAAANGAPDTGSATVRADAPAEGGERRRPPRRERPAKAEAAATDESAAPPAGEQRDRSRTEQRDGEQRQQQDRPRNQNQNQQGGGDSRQRDDDEYEGGSRSRRGRRYRDRRSRNRQTGGGGQGGADTEPTISEEDVLVPVAGVVDCVEEKNTWFIRTEGFYASPNDVYVANSFVRRFELRRGDAVTGMVRQPREGERREKYNPLVRLDTINGLEPEQAKNRVEFTKLVPLYPQERLRLETEPHILTTRVIDLVMPIGKGQRALIVSPPKAGKTMVLQSLANAIATNNPECHLMVVLVDERPEEVTDMQRSVKGEVVASTFDRKPSDHTSVAELSIERAKRLVEMGHDVVVLLDSITRLGRAYNLAAPASGRILSGGVDSTALYPPKRFLGAARNIENGGSLTIIATALVETGSAGDTVIFEEFKGTGNAELRLDRKIADKRVWPAVDVDQSSTRKEEILLSPDELAVTIKLRRVLHALEPQQAIDLLLDRLRKTRTNIEFLMQIAKTTPGQE